MESAAGNVNAHITPCSLLLHMRLLWHVLEQNEIIRMYFPFLTPGLTEQYPVCQVVMATH